MYPHRFSNLVVGYLNLATLLASIPVIGAGLWLAKGSAATCSSMLQTPLLAVGFVVLVVSLAGFVGACFHVAWALWLYLLAVMLLIAALLGLTAFAFAVTAGGGGAQVPGRPYREYRTSEYSSWLRDHVRDVKYWRPALACVLGSKACAKIANWTPVDYVQHDLTPIQVLFICLSALFNQEPYLNSEPSCPACAVWLLQATYILPVQRRRARGGAGRRLLQVEQRPQHPLLPVRLVQGRRHGAHAPGLAQGLRAHGPPPRRAHLRLRLRMLRLQERSPLRLRLPVRGEPHVQDQSTLGLLLVRALLGKTLSLSLSLSLSPSDSI
jgi:hypothetical protein